MVKAFVTGATGFVGSAVVRALLQRGIAAKILVRSASNLSNVAGLDVEFCVGDLLDEDSLVDRLRGCSLLFHVAAFYSTAESDGQRMYETNVGGTKTVMAAALRAGVERAVHTSTIGTVGQPAGGRLATEQDEFTGWKSASPYAKSKLLSEMVAIAAARSGLDVVVVNPCAPVGPRDIGPSSTGQRILDALHGHEPSFLRGGINFVPVQDVAEGHVLAAERGRSGERYILGHAEGNLQLADFLQIVARVAKRPGIAQGTRNGWRAFLSPWRRLTSIWRLRDVPVKDMRPAALTCDPARAIHELGMPQTSLDLALGQAIDWFREHGYI